jgi:hypothetical protein
LNKKLDKILNKVYELLKLNIMSKLAESSIQPNEIKQEINPELQTKITKLLTKYFENVELDEDLENKILEESLIIEEQLIDCSELNDEWLYINIKN